MSDGKIASDYKQFDCLSTYNTLSQIRKTKRSIVLRTRTCGVISNLHRNKIDVAKRGSRGQRPRCKIWWVSPPPPHPGSRSRAPFGGFLHRSSRYNKVQFYCRSAGMERALFLPISDKRINLILK